MLVFLKLRHSDHALDNFAELAAISCLKAKLCTADTLDIWCCAGDFKCTLLSRVDDGVVWYSNGYDLQVFLLLLIAKSLRKDGTWWPWLLTIISQGVRSGERRPSLKFFLGQFTVLFNEACRYLFKRREFTLDFFIITDWLRLRLWLFLLIINGRCRFYYRFLLLLEVHL